MFANSPIAAADEKEQEMIDAFEKWLEENVRPHVLRLEHADEYPMEMVEQMQEPGVFGATIGTEYGGSGLKACTYAKIVEKIVATWMSLFDIFNSHLVMTAFVERKGTTMANAVTGKRA
ncbi:MAG: acyl-CoA dehydrogenase family protein [Burkholderiaceae bacterium]